jgi:hypothetical protein
MPKQEAVVQQPIEVAAVGAWWQLAHTQQLQ